MMPGAAPKIRNSAPVNDSTDGSEPQSQDSDTSNKSSEPKVLAHVTKDRPTSTGRKSRKRPPSRRGRSSKTETKKEKEEEEEEEEEVEDSGSSLPPAATQTTAKPVDIPEPKKPAKTSENIFGTPTPTSGLKSSLFGDSGSLFTEKKSTSTSKTTTTNTSNAASIFDDPFSAKPPTKAVPKPASDPLSIFDDPFESNKKTTPTVKKSGGGLFD